MNSVNLIPIRHRQQRKLYARRKKWIRLVSIYTVVLTVTYGAWDVLWENDGRDLSRQLALVRGDLGELTKSNARQRVAFNETQMILRANQSVNGQPDWSLLLALVAKLRGDDLVLNQCGLDAASTSPKTAPAILEVSIAVPLLRLKGYGKTQAAVSQFALRLEETGLFESVSLLKTRRESFLAGEAIGFQVECRVKMTADAPAPMKLKPAAAPVHARDNNVAELSSVGDNIP